VAPKIALGEGGGGIIVRDVHATCFPPIFWILPCSAAHPVAAFTLSMSTDSNFPSVQNPIHEKKSNMNHDPPNRVPLHSQNGNQISSAFNSNYDQPSRKLSSEHPLKNGKSFDSSQLGNDFGNKDAFALSDGMSDPFGASRNGGSGDHKRAANDQQPNGPDDDGSKWIHRDKLARIESEELQAAGIIIPRARASSKARNRSQSRHHGHKESSYDGQEQPTSRSRKNSTAVGGLHDAATSSWDLRLPDEIAEDYNNNYWVSNGGPKGTSKIPVAKLSPAPLPMDYIERESPTIRRQVTEGYDGEAITYPKQRKRSGSMKDGHAGNTTMQPARRAATDISPKKAATTGARKTSAPTKGNPATGRPKTRSGPNKDSTSSSGTTRPSTRSGELSPANIKPQEGDPPWMVSAFQPDPRLPPDQQLLPTVARRIQQEKWEKEGKFGNIYDKEFRPLTDKGFLKPPEPENTPAPQVEEEPRLLDEWPLKTESIKSPGLRPGHGSYSTMPRIQDKPVVSPLPSPRTPVGQQHYPSPQQQHQPEIQQVTRLPEPPEEPVEKKGCACCIVM
jgi:hypothetical protein